LPPAYPHDLLPQIREAVLAGGAKLVVLDDDPTGNQTVHDVDVLTGWTVPMLTAALRDPNPVVYLLTNSRSLPLPQARALNREIAENLNAARAATGREVAVVSRSDSTLRGHYPGETDALAAALGVTFDATLIVPFFIEGGRITAHDIHYVTVPGDDGDRLIPAAQTEYARDAAFGYTHSDLRAWVSEKHGGALPPEAVAHISLDTIRRGGPQAVTARLMALDGAVCVVNAVSYRDLEVVVAGLLEAEARGKRFLYRTAASFVRVRGGIVPQPLLTHADVVERGLVDAAPQTGGLVVVGSHVQTTTRQVAAAAPLVRQIEVAVPALLDAARRDAEIDRVRTHAAAALRDGENVLVYTSREVVTAAPSQEGDLDALAIGQRVSQALVALVRELPVRPAWIIAKGGITASDVATGGLGIRRAAVLGQALPGIPVWATGPESRWPGLVYVVFPGNVGGDDALAAMIEMLTHDLPRH
jgi:uncharacterized protein YgbK (DUF1537 family)